MSEPDSIKSTLGKYDDRERLETILRLHRAEHISTEEAVNLLTGDRNYMATETLEEIRKSVVERNSMSTIWSQWPTGIYPSTTTFTSTSTSGGPITYSTV